MLIKTRKGKEEKGTIDTRGQVIKCNKMGLMDVLDVKDTEKHPKS